MRRASLLGVTALCLAAFVAADTRPGRQEDKSTPEDGVLRLRKGNFDRALRKHKQLLVHFYAPLSGEGHQVLAAFKGAAAELQGSEVKPAVLDVTEEKELAKELNATGLPAIKLYLSGDKHNPAECPVPRSSASILTWLKRRAGSAADLVADLSQSEASEELTVVGFFKELNCEYVQVFYAAAIDLPDVSFAVTQDDQVISKYGLPHDVVLLLKRSKLILAYKMMPQTSKEELIIFITVYQMDPVTEYTGKTATQILTSPVLNHALLFANKSSADFKEIYFAFNRAAEAFRLKILFVWVNVDEPRNGRLMEYFQVRAFEAPLVRLVNLTDHVTYHLPSDTLDVESIKKFCQSYLEGTAKPKMQSEPIPEGWDKRPVKELVGMTLEKVAFNPNKTVFVLFYLPYSQQSRALFPLWEELAEALKEREDVVVARIDASANDINISMQGTYPSLCLFPALYAERVVFYPGKRKLKDLIKFVNKEMEKAKKDRVKEDEDRREYIEAIKAEEAKKANKTKDEL
ncbi:LOW QUALITY PROTEIN: protein disulfide-isomerase [Chelmon rostratus]|uniref:LOW QUALITY PROTEIN: protein disulfide-isomerase n=1 Tax=Chelmon rostratus TaxID=109905 RepID=UPI001BEBEFDF|nr:LOW QUALITY PROTEIN: protein disulfide-isomerase [Chelmon rostratus]